MQNQQVNMQNEQQVQEDCINIPSTNGNELLQRLAEPFTDDEIEWKIRAIRFLTSR